MIQQHMLFLLVFTSTIYVHAPSQEASILIGNRTAHIEEQKNGKFLVSELIGFYSMD